ncbi:hypothetical protein [Arenimonas sp. SCN 70-307]|uniref:hypothetical protein n=1 Tax=Arenimonas sp. SCN 70-307 TaxID=1660089 RepID=UPI0025BDBDF6|nr:hypothetical protein [Arenimonas sp. SCN 70-307]
MKSFLTISIVASFLALLFSAVTAKRGESFSSRFLTAVFWAISVSAFIAVSQELAQLLELSRKDSGYARGRLVPSPFSFFVVTATASQTYTLWRLRNWLRKTGEDSEREQPDARAKEDSSPHAEANPSHPHPGARSTQPIEAEPCPTELMHRKFNPGGLTIFLLCASGLNAYGSFDVYDKSPGGAIIFLVISIGCLVGAVGSSIR